MHYLTNIPTIAIHFFNTLLLCCYTTHSKAGEWQFNESIAGFTQVNLYIPDTQSAIGNGKSLLILLHGCVQGIENYTNANLDRAADEYGMVIAIPDAEDKAGFNCWSYWQGEKSREAGDYKRLINLATSLSQDPNLHIDKDQVYIAGLSSGATFAHTTACLAPDIFAGMGISAGPSIGTSQNGAISTCESAPVKARCLNYAGNFQQYFESQIASIAHGNRDSTVNQCYLQQNAEGMAEVYGVSETDQVRIITEDSGRSAIETTWSINGSESIVTTLELQNLGHAWSGGANASGAYIDSASINYAAYLGQYFTENNRRATKNSGPVIENFFVVPQPDNSFLLSAHVNDIEGFVQYITVTVESLTQHSRESWQYIPEAPGLFTAATPALANDLYAISFSATDNEGLTSDVTTATERLGPEPPPTAPELQNSRVEIDGRCVVFQGEYLDINQDLSDITIQVNDQIVSAEITGQTYLAQLCDLNGGSYSALVTARDLPGLSSSITLSFSLESGSRGDYNHHISEGHITWSEGYASCYLEYGTSEFTLFKKRNNDTSCRWEDQDASCSGPLMDCASSAPSPVPVPNCTQHTSQNYFHKIAGRAYSTGNLLAPNYYTEGGKEPMNGSTWGVSTVYSSDNLYWSLGNCE